MFGGFHFRVMGTALGIEALETWVDATVSYAMNTTHYSIVEQESDFLLEYKFNSSNAVFLEDLASLYPTGIKLIP